MRADVLLVERGLAASRTAAQRLIAGGHVFMRAGSQRAMLSKAGVDLSDDVQIEIEANELDRFVSRGGLKLEGALNRIGLNVEGLVCLDVGQSTGGFTDCLLQRGAAHVVGIDVGRDQLHPSLRDDSRVTCIEGINARALTVDFAEVARDGTLGASEPRHFADPDTGAPHVTTFAASRSHRSFDLIVADVSFISLTKVLPPWPTVLREIGHVLSLVKPQFEVGAENVGRGGIVRDASLYRGVERLIRDACERAKLDVLDYFESPIVGGDGNREFFVYAKHAGAQ